MYFSDFRNGKIHAKSHILLLAHEYWRKNVLQYLRAQRRIHKTVEIVVDDTCDKKFNVLSGWSAFHRQLASPNQVT